MRSQKKSTQKRQSYSNKRLRTLSDANIKTNSFNIFSSFLLVVTVYNVSEGGDVCVRVI